MGEKNNVTVSAAKDKDFTVGGKRYKGMDRTCDAIKAWAYPLFDKFAAGTYTHDGDGITLGRAVYKPDGAATDGGKNPMIVWLHGAGEGGDDISLPLLAYDTVGLADGRVQKYFTSAESAGAYVAVLQCPTYWLETADGKNGAEGTYTDGQPSKYAEAVSAAIDDIVERDADIDPDRIYIAGCSNGGFITLKLAADYGDKYAAYVPICHAYANKNVNAEILEGLSERSIWFVQSEDDTTMPPAEYGVPIFYRLIAAGAKNVHYTMLDGLGHNSWSAFLDDEISTRFDNAAVAADFPNVVISADGAIEGDGYYVKAENCTVETESVFAWLAKQRNAG